MIRPAAILFLWSGVMFAQIYGPPQVQAYAPSPLLNKIGITQQLNAPLPLDVPFADEENRRVTLRTYSGKPLILALVYYQCPSLCNLVLNGVVRAVRRLDLAAGEDYQVVAISIDPRETAQMARDKLQSYRQSSEAADQLLGWHFLTGPEASSKAVASATGFHYVYDGLTNQYAHSSAIMIVTPTGKIARYFYGIDYPARDVRLGLVEAARERIGTITDQVLLYCFHYDPSTGKYALVVMNVLRLAGAITLLLLGLLMAIFFHRDYRNSRIQKRSAA